jgi:hypothetical protein
VLAVTLIFGLAFMKSATICFMNGPSPPVKPFQYDSVTVGPLYPVVNVPDGLLTPAASWADLPPPHAVSPAAAAAAPPSARRCRRERAFRALLSVMVVPSSSWW